ncbi:SGNH/GDSL hydrolase family protein [Bacillus sp. 165]|uniref:SGNH/GDSL hydrolase family protein n=1 Tax=Bacillus sp. 165 TaxID=1529117 RepID=UPI001ADA2EC0|nr:SGNH/GDSL hydrolase family protein [Bacillus sp. 165]MBO9130140.1 SGNH/GDSL hydrolase family protein [Bacillus sp. 165]
MRSTFVKVMLLLTIISFSFFAYGFVMGVKDVLKPEASNLPQLNEKKERAKIGKEQLHIVSLGDSLTRGVGDKEGIGYIGRVKGNLETQYGQKTMLVNLAVSGAKMKDLAVQLSSKGAQYSIQQADIIILTIGGNDLFPGWETLGNVDFTKYRPDVTTFAENVNNILTELRKLNPESPIFWVGLYNPFEDVQDLKGSSETVVNWNSVLEKTALNYSKTYIVPMFDLFQSRGNELLYTDHFHPNDKGYELIGSRLMQNITSQLNIHMKDGEAE